MKETLETLQTLVLLMTLLLQIIMVLGIVYAFRLILQVLREFSAGNIESIRGLLKTIDKAAKEEPLMGAHTKAQPSEATEPQIPRAKCHRCSAKLPEQPKDSRIEGEATILVFKCGRCGKDTEVDAASGVVLTPPHAK